MKIIKYGAPWCGPCKTMSHILKESKYPYEEINIEENEDIVEEKGIRNIPYIEIVDDNNNVVDKHVGLLSATQLNEIMESYGNN